MGEPEKKVPTGDMPYKKKWGNGNRNKKRVGHRPQVTPVKFKGGKEEIDGHYFDCTGYGQSDRFMKTVEKIAGYVGQDYKGGGLTCTEVMSQAVAITFKTAIDCYVAQFGREGAEKMLEIAIQSIKDGKHDVDPVKIPKNLLN